MMKIYDLFIQLSRYQAINNNTVSAVLTAALLLNLNFLGAALKREFTYSRIFYFVSIYVS